MTKVYVYMLHLSYGGIEKAVTNLINVLVEKYEVHVMVMYPLASAYTIDSRAKVHYLLDQEPNREAFLAAKQNKQICKMIKEGLKAIKVLYLKKHVLKKSIKAIKEGCIITTRHEDNMMLAKYGNEHVYKIGQLHHDFKVNTHTYQLDLKLENDIKKGYDNLDVLVVLTKQLQLELEQILGLHQHMKVVAIGNMLEDYPKTLNLSMKEKVCIATGRMHEVKGFDRLLDLFEEICKREPSWQLYLVGDGPQLVKLKQKVIQKHLEEHIIFYGYQTSEQIAILNTRASIYLMTSFSEGLPMVLLEAMARGVVPIAYDVRVGPRAIIHNHSGYLVEDGDRHQYIDTCIKLMNDQKLRQQMAKECYHRAGDFRQDTIKQTWFLLLAKGDL